MKAIIAGGGIGGLTTALCLHRAGVEVQVYESVKEIKPLGVGINALPHCVRVLTDLGLQEKLAMLAIATSELSYFNRYGQLFWSEPRGLQAGYKWPQFSVHRGGLQMILWEEVKRVVGEQAIHTNHHLEHFEDTGEGIKAWFIDKENGDKQTLAEGDILVGADGINSVVRAQLYPNEGPPVYSENVLYRGTTVMKGFLNGSTMAMIGSLKQKMVVYPIENLADGQQLVNWVANLKEGKSKLTARDWNRQADKERLIAIYSNWNFDWLDVPEMIAGSKAVYEFPMSDRDPLKRWSFGRVTLLGDAAHPMYPIGSNGASQAILDAESLARCLMDHSNPEIALQAYNDERLPATSRVVLQNRAKGPDEIMDIMEERFPEGFEPHEIPKAELAGIMDHYKQIAGFQVDSLNKKAALADS